MTLDQAIRRLDTLQAELTVQALLDHDTEQRAEIARLREALVEIIEKCEDEDWEYMFGDIIIRARQALKESAP